MFLNFGIQKCSNQYLNFSLSNQFANSSSRGNVQISTISNFPHKFQEQINLLFLFVLKFRSKLINFRVLFFSQRTSHIDLMSSTESSQSSTISPLRQLCQLSFNFCIKGASTFCKPFKLKFKSTAKRRSVRRDQSGNTSTISFCARATRIGLSKFASKLHCDRKRNRKASTCVRTLPKAFAESAFNRLCEKFNLKTIKHNNNTFDSGHIRSVRDFSSCAQEYLTY